MSLKKHIVSPGQSLVDVAIQWYGRAEDVFQILALNPSLDLGSSLTAGQTLLIDPAQANRVSRLFTQREYVPNNDQKGGCAMVSPSNWVPFWGTTWDGTKHVVNNLSFIEQGIVASAVYSEDVLIYASGSLIGSANPYSNIYSGFVSYDTDYGALSTPGAFGFLPGTYEVSLRFDFITLIDGTVCSYTLNFGVSWPNGPGAPSLLSFDYELPVTF